MPFARAQEEHRAPHITGAVDVDLDRVALVLYNAKVSLEDAYDATGNKECYVASIFHSRKRACRWRRTGFFSTLN
jgi:hypothetical protein